MKKTQNTGHQLCLVTLELIIGTLVLIGNNENHVLTQEV